MANSYTKYGAVADAYPEKVNALESLNLRLQKYLETGNTEYLIDVANFAMIEFMWPRLLTAHYTQSDTSPGRVWNDNTVTQQANTSQQENSRLGGQKGSTAGGLYKREGD